MDPGDQEKPIELASGRRMGLNRTHPLGVVSDVPHRIRGGLDGTESGFPLASHCGPNNCFWNCLSARHEG